MFFFFLLIVIISTSAASIPILFTFEFFEYKRLLKESKLPFGRGTFQDFKKEFKKVENWDYSENPGCLSCYNETKRISVLDSRNIIFNEQLMLLNFINYCKVQICILIKIRNMKKEKFSKKETVKW
jgi:hypothetical protein